MSFPVTTATEADIVLATLGIDPTRTNIKQMQVLLDAYRKFIERNDIYVDLWKEGGMADSVRNADSKVARLRALGQSLELQQAEMLQTGTMPQTMTAIGDSAMDSALDLINYAAFAARNLHSGRFSRSE